MQDRDSRLQQIRDQQTRWMRERQSEKDREKVMAELQAGANHWGRWK